ncbi:hypothetical protein RI367_008420 [Sorochytrium milnesiophthora]
MLSVSAALFAIWCVIVVASASSASGAVLCNKTNSRVRMEIRDLTPQQWTRFVKAMWSLRNRPATIPKYAGLSLYEQYVAIHYDHATDKHSDPRFLPWHNLFLRYLENDLQRYDKSVTLPYWGWDRDSETPEQSPVLSAHYLGSSSPGKCVPNGSFVNMTSRVSGRGDHGPTYCISRGYSPSVHTKRLTSTAELAQMMHNATSFSAFSFRFEMGGHSTLHNFIQGDMAYAYSPNDALFFLHHAFVDKTWRDFQSKYKFPYDGQAYSSRKLINRTATMNDVLLPFAKSNGKPYTVADVYDGTNLCEVYIPLSNQTVIAKAKATHPTLMSFNGTLPPVPATPSAPVRQLVTMSPQWAKMMRLTPAQVANVNAVNNQTQKQVQALVKIGKVANLTIPHAPVPKAINDTLHLGPGH